MIHEPDRDPSEEQQSALHLLLGLLSTIGSANDAEDHHYPDDARRIREESCESIRNLMEQHTFLAGFFPTLQWELDSQHILGFGWSNLYHEVENRLYILQNGQEGG
jgi:hypothetical protein